MTTHTTHRMHQNSVDCFAALDCGARHERIIAAYSDAGRPLTDRQVLWHLNAYSMRQVGPEMNAVRPRITELIKTGRLEEVGKTVCDVTGHRVRLVTFVQEAKL